ncbi:MAG: bifunctional 5,10-methylenetetrahydrofolate dehydrogenase/5,10-methenyltetrahydrofolate cyclohydrolase [Patescibacteria group bacterium]|jgi:methylenetetrahydrofolate dehydrogenase (NADP+)/methenyltetrahydrofolate cyclohydrolase
MEIIDGRKIAEKVKDGIVSEICKFNGPRPSLAIILIGEREDSKLYVSLKEKEGAKVGVDTHLYKIDSDVSEEEVLKVIDFLNKDKSIDSILIQLPLPEKFNADKIIAAINPEKDVDGFHPRHPDYIVSPVLASVNACLEEIKFDSRGKKACLFYNSEVFGLGLKKLLTEMKMEIISQETVCRADLLITALGEPLKIKKGMVKEGAVVIDIGITKKDGKVLGDVDSSDLKDIDGFITPVPGGIGPMTIAFLFKNVLEIFKRKIDSK